MVLLVELKVNDHVKHFYSSRKEDLLSAISRHFEITQRISN
jgi:hypothetical protein